MNRREELMAMRLEDMTEMEREELVEEMDKYYKEHEARHYEVTFKNNIITVTGEYGTFSNNYTKKGKRTNARREFIAQVHANYPEAALKKVMYFETLVD